MWALAVTRLSTEFHVRDQLKLECFLPYTYEKIVVTVTPPRTTSTPRPRATHVVTKIKVARWPGYLFAKVLSSEELNTLITAKGVSYLVRNGEGEPAILNNFQMNILRMGCAPDGQVLRASELHRFEVGELLRFVAKSSFAGLSGEVLSIAENGNLDLLVEGRLKATAHYSELTNYLD